MTELGAWLVEAGRQMQLVHAIAGAWILGGLIIWRSDFGRRRR